MEDILTVIDGRPELIKEFNQISADVNDYLKEEFEELLSDPEFTNSINWHLSGDEANQTRIPIIIERIRAIAGL